MKQQEGLGPFWILVILVTAFWALVHIVSHEGDCVDHEGNSVMCQDDSAVLTSPVAMMFTIPSALRPSGDRFMEGRLVVVGVTAQGLWTLVSTRQL